MLKKLSLTESRRETLLILALALLVGLAFQGSRHLWDPDEGRYTSVAHQMRATGDWLIPRLHPERPHLTKPPLTYWAIAAGFELIGANEWGARLANALAFAATAVLVLAIARRLALPSPPFAAAVWSTLLGPVAGANIVSTDTLLVLFETLAVFGFVATGLLAGRERPHALGLRVMWLGFGLAFLTKGPPGLLPLLAIVVWTAWQRRDALRRLFEPAGIALFAAVGLGWYLLLVMREPQLLHYFIVQETFERFATDRFGRNGHLFGWLEAYGPILVAGTLPWSLFIPWLRHRARAASAVAEPRPASTELTARSATDPLAVRRLLWLWLLLPLGVFILSRSRLPLYVLPLFVPIALLAGTTIQGRLPQGPLLVCVSLAALFVVAIKLAASFVHRDNDAHRLAGELAATVDLGRIDELVFVDMPARYGLRHYLGLYIEQAETESGLLGPGGYVGPTDVCAELDESERQLLIVPSARLAAFEQKVSRCQARLEPLGPLRKWRLYRPLRRPPA